MSASSLPSMTAQTITLPARAVSLPDPRQNTKVLYPLEEIVLPVACATAGVEPAAALQRLAVDRDMARLAVAARELADALASTSPSSDLKTY